MHNGEKTLKFQRDFYDDFYADFGRGKIEKMKQSLRLRLISCLAGGYYDEGSRILIAGCGNGEDSRALNTRSVGFDFSYAAIKTASRFFPENLYAVADGMKIPFAAKTFDCIVCSEVLEHIIRPREMLSELCRVLKDDGKLVITVPNWLCWYGLARKTAEFILRRPVTACDQPIDNWYTLRRLREDLDPCFVIERVRGSWYYPPFAKGYHRGLDSLFFPVFRFFRPLDVLFGELSPSWGSHILAVRCSKKIKVEE